LRQEGFHLKIFTDTPMHSRVAVEISLSFPFEGKKWKEFCGSLKSSLRKQRIYCGWRHPADRVSGKENAQSSYSCMTVLSVCLFSPFFFLFFLPFILHYHALAPHPSPAERVSPALPAVLLFPRCATLVCSGSGKAKSTETLISEAHWHTVL